MQAARIIAQLLVMGSGLLVRAFAQAYRQALASRFSFASWFFYALSTYGLSSQIELGLILGRKAIHFLQFKDG